MADLDTITSIPAISALALVFRGFWPFMVKHPSEELRLFSIGMIMIVGGKMLRIFYWNVLRSGIIEYDPDAWLAWVRLVHGASYVNGIFNLIFLVGSIYILRGFMAMIPADERKNWNILTAPFYPHGWCVRRMVNRLSGKWKS